MPLTSHLSMNHPKFGAILKQNKNRPPLVNVYSYSPYLISIRLNVPYISQTHQNVNAHAVKLKMYNANIAILFDISSSRFYKFYFYG